VEGERGGRKKGGVKKSGVPKSFGKRRNGKEGGRIVLSFLARSEIDRAERRGAHLRIGNPEGGEKEAKWRGKGKFGAGEVVYRVWMKKGELLLHSSFLEGKKREKRIFFHYRIGGG